MRTRLMFVILLIIVGCHKQFTVDGLPVYSETVPQYEGTTQDNISSTLERRIQVLEYQVGALRGLGMYQDDKIERLTEQVKACGCASTPEPTWSTPVEEPQPTTQP